MDKQALYSESATMLESTLTGSQLDRVGAMATLVALLHEKIPYFDWTGFYRVTQKELLTIGPYQGHLACLQIPFARGVCGQAARERRTVVVDDVRKHPDYIACSGSTLSEIVVPVIERGQVTAVLDIDSDKLSAFDHSDARYLEQMVQKLLQHSAP